MPLLYRGAASRELRTRKSRVNSPSLSLHAVARGSNRPGFKLARNVATLIRHDASRAVDMDALGGRTRRSESAEHFRAHGNDAAHLGLKETRGRYDRASVAIEFALDLDGDREATAISRSWTRPRWTRCFQVATIVCHSNVCAAKLDLCLPEWVYEKIRAKGIRAQS